MSDLTEAPGPRWQRRPTERRREILDAAAMVFGEKGYESATLANVAERAGISPGTVQHYFGNKATLFNEVVSDRFLDGAEEDEALLVEHRGSYAELLDSLIERNWIRLSRPGSADLLIVGMTSAMSCPEAGLVVSGEVGMRCPRVIQRVIEAGIRQGEFRPVDPERVSRIISATVIGMVIGRQRLMGLCKTPLPEPKEVLRDFLGLLGRGLGRDQGSGIRDQGSEISEKGASA
jgi:AcrR family transcriptional regulator